MADSRTLAEVRSDARARADMEAGGSLDFVTNAQANVWINLAIAELRGVMIGEYGDDWLSKKSGNLTTTNGQDLDALPADFYKLLGVDVSFDSGSTWQTSNRFEFAERNRWQSAAWGANALPYHRPYGSNIMWRPVPAGTYTYRLWYAPTITRLTADGDPFDYVHGWDDWVAQRVAIRMLMKEAEPSIVMAMKDDLVAIMQRIAAEVRHRDAGSPKRVADTARRSPDRIISDLFETEGV